MTPPELNIVSRPAASDGAGHPPVLFVHGAWHGAWCWEAHFLDHFAQAGFEAHALDLRGHGGSPAVKSMRRNRISDYVEDVLHVIAGFERKPVIIGHSMGGFIVQHCLAKTDRLAGAGLLATVPHGGVLGATVRVALHQPLDFLRANLTWSLYPLVDTVKAAQHLFLEDDVSEEQARTFAARLGDESYLAFLDMLVLNLPSRPKSNVPVRVVGAEKDAIFTASSQHATARRYGAECTIIGGAPHDLMLASQWREAADLFIGWIR